MKLAPKHEIDVKLLEKLRPLGLGESMAQRVISHFGSPRLEMILFDLDPIKRNPYLLMDVEGISFKRADGIAMSLGITNDNDPRRRKALIKHTLEQNASLGHTYLPKPKLLKELKKARIFEADDLLKEMLVDGELHISGSNNDEIFLLKYWMAEVGIASVLSARKHLGTTNDKITSPWLRNPVDDFPELKDDVDQTNVILSFLGQKDIIITGGPGTGKSHLTKIICKILDRTGQSYALCAPTGKAAKRLQEVTGHSAKTIHRFLGGTVETSHYSTFEWKYNAGNQITKYNTIVIDECSMLDVNLAWKLIQAIPNEVNLIFIGDVDQLAPVGPGAFFRDLIKSGITKTYWLKTNHRQGKGSLIAENALRINRGEMRLTMGDDLSFIEASNPIAAREKILNLILKLAEDYPNTLEDVQVLSPQKSTVVGVTALNEMLRFELNPNAKSNQKFSVGDKVMQTKNNYKLQIFNGFCGIIADETKTDYLINFFGNDKQVKYPKSLSRSQLMLAYCCTVHKYQGSECKAGIIVISSSHTWMLTRNLIYTGITRFKEKCILLADMMGLKRAIHNTKEQTRYSRLLEKLHEANIAPKHPIVSQGKK